MPTPAEVLLENSTLNTGTPWEHLCNQAAGSGGFTIADLVEVEVMDAEIDIEMEEEISVEVEAEISVEVEAEIDVEMA